MELREEGLNVAGLAPEQPDGKVAEQRYIDDSHIDIAVPAELPDSYISQTAEKLKLYRELDSIATHDKLQEFASRLVDRFGVLPREAEELLNVVRLRWEAIRLGMERVKVKNGLMIVHFVSDPQSSYFKSEVFMTLLKKVTAEPDRYVLRNQNDRLAMTIRRVADIESAYKLLSTL